MIDLRTPSTQLLAFGIPFFGIDTDTSRTNVDSVAVKADTDHDGTFAFLVHIVSTNVEN